MGWGELSTMRFLGLVARSGVKSNELLPRYWGRGREDRLIMRLKDRAFVFRPV